MKNYLRISFLVIILVDLLGTFWILPLATDFTWLGLLLTALFAWLVLELINAPPLLWAGSLFAIVLDIISATFGLYSRIYAWDVFMHLMGGTMVGFFGLEIITRKIYKEHTHRNHTNLLIIVGVILLTITTGFLYELAEYLIDRFQYGSPKSLVSAYNTIEDQLFNLVGTVLTLSIYFIRKQYKK